MGEDLGWIYRCQERRGKRHGRCYPTDCLDMNSVVSGTEGGRGGAVFDVTIPLTIDGNVLTRIIAQLQWNQNTVTVRNLGVASS